MDKATIERFERDIAKHEIQVLLDDGNTRRVLFKKPGSWDMHFQLVTWPGYLCFTGDMGTYVFQRLDDMFKFFRKEPRPGRHLFDSIDRRYWAEKCEAADKTDGIREWSPELFHKHMTRMRRQMVVEHGRDLGLDKEQRTDLWNELGWLLNSHDEHEAYEAMRNFSWRPRGVSLREDVVLPLWDGFPDCKTYTFRFDWCCMALAWGINEYDKFKAQANAATQP